MCSVCVCVMGSVLCIVLCFVFVCCVCCVLCGVFVLYCVVLCVVCVWGMFYILVMFYSLVYFDLGVGFRVCLFLCLCDACCVVSRNTLCVVCFVDTLLYFVLCFV